MVHLKFQPFWSLNSSLEEECFRQENETLQLFQFQNFYLSFAKVQSNQDHCHISK